MNDNLSQVNGDMNITVTGNGNDIDVNKINSLFSNQNNAINALKKRIECLDVIKKDIKDIKGEFKKFKCKNIPTWVYYIWFISIVALILAGSAIFMDSGLIWNVEIISISIILAFLGFLTTFIVISNYAQVKEVKDEFTKQITDTKDEFGKEVSEIESLRKEIEDLRKKISSKFDQYNGNFLQMFMRNDDFQENFNTNYDKFKNLHEILKEISDRLDKVEQIDKQ